MYAYCQGDPVNNTDPSGHIKLPTWAKIAIGTVGIAAAVAITVATGGAAAPALIAAVQIVAASVVTSAAISAGAAAVSSRLQTGSWNGAGNAALKGAKEGAIDGYMWGGVGAAASATVKAVQIANATKNVANATKAAEGVCFVSGTLVSTRDGYKQIQDIKVGDKVYSENPETGEKGLKQVKNVFVHETNVLVHVFVGKEEIKTTPTHPFWVEGEGWIAAGELKVGDKLSLYSGKPASVDKIFVEKLEEPVKVYNFEVEDWHTYFVSGLQVLVHNTCAQEIGGKITGYTRHGINQAIGRDGGLGVAPSAILDTVKNPLLVVNQSGGKIMYTGKNSTVVLNKIGKVITTWATNRAGIRGG